MKKKINGRIVPRGVIEDRGYVFVRLFVHGKAKKVCVGNVKEPNVVQKAIDARNEFVKNRREGKTDFVETPNRLTTAQAAEIYWKLHASKKPSARFYKYVLEYFKRLLPPYIDMMTKQDVELYRARRTTEGVKQSTINREQTILVHLFNALKEWRDSDPPMIKNVKLPEENPASKVKKVDERPYRRGRIVSPEEFDRLLEASNTNLRAILMAAMNTMLRRKDLASLTKANVKGGQLEGVQAKTQKPYEVPITRVMHKIIDTAPGDKVLNMTNFRRAFDEARTKAGLRDVQMRDIRRTAARTMLTKGVDLATVSSWLGHASLTMTEAYVQTQKAQKEAAGKILESTYELSQKLSVNDLKRRAENARK